MPRQGSGLVLYAALEAELWHPAHEGVALCSRQKPCAEGPLCWCLLQPGHVCPGLHRLADGSAVQEQATGTSVALITAVQAQIQ